VDNVVKITVAAEFFTVGNMNINTCHSDILHFLKIGINRQTAKRELSISYEE
jgi:hypothetical protein